MTPAPTRIGRMTTSRRAPAPIAVAVAAITTVGITITILVVVRIAPTAVTITAIPRVPIVTTITAISTIVRVAVGRPAVSHVFPRSWGMRPISHRIINADAAAVQVLGIKIGSREVENLVAKRTHNAIQLINALRGFLNSAHSDKAKATRPVRLMWSEIVK